MSDTVGGKNELSAIKAPLLREVKKGETRRHIISVLVRNELGVLARIATLIAGKGYNIEGLSVGETHEKGFSLMTIEVIGDDVVIEQVVKQLRKLIDTIKVRDLTDSPHVERELALIKVYTATPRQETRFSDLQRSLGARSWMFLQTPTRWRSRGTRTK
jgi:acetolactate synthase-1/3 small subunit